MTPIRAGSTSALLKEPNGCMDVPLPSPSEAVRVALALTFAATVEQQHAVTVAGQHPRLVLRSGPTGERDHGRPVLRRDVPALQLQAVARGELDVLVRGSELWRAAPPPAPTCVTTYAIEVGRRTTRTREHHADREQQAAPRTADAGCRSAAATSRGSRSRWPSSRSPAASDRNPVKSSPDGAAVRRVVDGFRRRRATPKKPKRSAIDGAKPGTQPRVRRSLRARDQRRAARGR